MQVEEYFNIFGKSAGLGRFWRGMAKFRQGRTDRHAGDVGHRLGMTEAGHIFFLMVEIAPFSKRDTCAWEMPISVETSI